MIEDITTATAKCERASVVQAWVVVKEVVVVVLVEVVVVVLEY